MAILVLVKNISRMWKNGYDPSMIHLTVIRDRGVCLGMSHTKINIYGTGGHSDSSFCNKVSVTFESLSWQGSTNYQQGKPEV